MNEAEIIARINQRRKQILVHSVLYYKLGTSIVSDTQWNKWAYELDELHKSYPNLLEKCWRNDVFHDFDPSSGYYLPLSDYWAFNKAQWLLNRYNKLEEKNRDKKSKC